MPRHAAKLAFGFVISMALASYVLRYYSVHGPINWGVDLSAVGPSVETIEDTKFLSMASFLRVKGKGNVPNGND